MFSKFLQPISFINYPQCSNQISSKSVGKPVLYGSPDNFFNKPSNQMPFITFIITFVGGDSFQDGTFDRLQRPVKIAFAFYSETYCIPEKIFKPVLYNKQNKITFFQNSHINCQNCGNLWLIRGNKQQIESPFCIGNIHKHLFDSDVKEKLKLKCG